jgi:UDPglucose 6-dehydrogenase
LRAVPEFDVASNPEFLQEGRAIENFFHPDRIVLGVDTQRSRDLLETIYRPLKCPMVVTNPTTAELIKHAANAFLSTKISFINMVADMCEAVEADVASVAKGIGLDPRIGTQFLSAGIGFGGYCFPKDLRAFIHLGEQHGVDCTLLRAVESINHARIEAFLQKVREALWVVSGKTIAILGLAFKPQTDDIREAPSLKIIEALLREGANLRLYDPEAMANAQQAMPEEAGRLTYCASACEAVRGAHALAILTDWDEFRKLDLARVRALMEVPIVVDGRNIWEPEAVRNAGFEYHCMGRRSPGHAMAPSRTRLSPQRRPRAVAVG